MYKDIKRRGQKRGEAVARGLKKLCKSSLREGWPIYLLALITFVAGIVAGWWGAGGLNSEQVGQLLLNLDQFMNQASQLNIDRQSMIRDTITNNLAYIGIIYLLGLTVIGMPVILALLFARGFSLGFTISFLAREKAGEGIVLALSSVVPQNLLLIPAILLASVAALSFSWLLLKRFLNSRLPILPGLIGYHLLILVVCCICSAAGLVEAYITPELIKATAAFLTK